jgi:hypothetical protein
MLCLESKQLACWDPLQFLKNWVSKIVSKNCFLKKLLGVFIDQFMKFVNHFLPL